MKIIALNLGKLINAKHINFMLFVKTAISLFSVVGEKFAAVVASFLAAFDEENDVFLKHTRKFLTEEIGNADTLRDSAFRRLRDVIKSFLLDPDAAKKAAAQKLLNVIDLYGGTDIPGMAIDAESGILTNLVEDFELEYPELVALLGVGPLLAGLKSANEEYLRLMSERTEHDAEYGREAVAKARRKTDQAYRNLVWAVNIAADNGMAAELTPFMKYLNAEVERYRIQLGQGAGNPSGFGDGEEDGETTILTKTATFKFINGDIIKRQVEVGTVLIAPDNTEGYVWNKEIPELMPNKNLTFHEVPIEEAKATATFHFLNHTEEEITQVVGTPLVAPVNTEGCVWEPEVPAIMPEEDTAYYEVPQNPNPENPGGGDNGDNNGTTTDPDDPWYNPDDEPD